MSPLPAAPSWTATGESPGDHFAEFVAAAGDVNRDGYADVLIGAWGHATLGKAYLYLGGATGLAQTPSWTIVGAGGGFGRVAGAGDVNGDGYSDFAVTASGQTGYTGAAFVFDGGPGGPSSLPTWSAQGEATNDYFGTSIATAGDVNGDGYSDLLVGAPGNDSERGKAYLFLGSASGLAVVPSWTAQGETNASFYGISVAAAGDVDDDGFDDVLVGAYAFPNLEYTGRAYLYLGTASGLAATPAWTATGEGSYNAFGYSLAGAGDVNGDGFDDVFVGAWGYPIFGRNGKVYLYLGGPSGLSAIPAWAAVGEDRLNNFGESMGSAGDVNGDGRPDLICGAWGYNSAQGKAYLHLGGGSGPRRDAGLDVGGGGLRRRVRDRRFVGRRRERRRILRRRRRSPGARR